ncbi:MAG: cupin domain-containing protein [Elusimicrobia bacterium]|nr:cupin domain-containing protein [Elusimicrobiota bacterium]
MNLNNITTDELIKLYDLKPHPEGGFYKETYRSEGFISKTVLPEGFNGKRNYSTAIYFLGKSPSADTRFALMRS